MSNRRNRATFLTRFRNGSIRTAAASVDGGRVYASECTYPAIQVGLDTGHLKTATYYEELGSGTILTAWSATRDYSMKNPNVIRGFAKAWQESATYTNAHHAETVDMMSEFTNIQPAVIASMPRATAGPTFTAAQVQPLIDLCYKYGALKASFPAANMIDPNLH